MRFPTMWYVPPTNVRHFGRGHFGLGRFGPDISATEFRPRKMPKVDVSAITIICGLWCVLA